MISTSETSCSQLLSPFRQPPTSYKACVYGWQRQPHRSRSVTAYLQSEDVTSVPWPALRPDLNPIVHIWNMLGRRMQAWEPPVQNIRQLEAALHREWQQISQQDTRRLTGGMRRRFEAVIQARGGYTRSWTLNNRCRQVIHKWRFESEMAILSCFLDWDCEGQYLNRKCFTAKTGLVILWLNIHWINIFLDFLWFLTGNVMSYQVTIAFLRLSGQYSRDSCRIICHFKKTWGCLTFFFVYILADCWW